jgi:hypothetical protein
MEPEYITYRSTQEPFVLDNQRSVGGYIATLVQIGIGKIGITVAEERETRRPYSLYINCGNFYGVLEVGQSIHVISNIINRMYAVDRDGTRYDSRWMAVIEYKECRGNEREIGMLNFRSNSERANLGNIFDVMPIPNCNMVEIGHVYRLPDIQLNGSQFLSFFVNMGDGPQFYIPLIGYGNLNGFYKSFYDCQVTDRNYGFRLGIGRNDVYNLRISSLKLMKVSINNTGGNQAKSVLIAEPVNGEWDVEFRFYNDVVNSHDDELLFIQHDKDNLVNHTNIGLRLVYPINCGPITGHKYFNNHFHNNGENILNVHVESIRFTFPTRDPGDNGLDALLMLLRRY